jgi:hypothetical protein
MNKLKLVLFFAALLVFAPKAKAACTITAGMTGSQIQTALNACTSGQTASFPAGSYAMGTTTVTIPCGVSLSGPILTYSQTPNQTAILNGSSSNGATHFAFQTTTGCSASQTIQWLDWDGKQPSDGGGFLQIIAGTTNLTVQNNWLHGVNTPGPGYGGVSGGGGAGDLILFCCTTTTITSNVTIQWNYFGNASFSDCATAMTTTAPNEDSDGGGCGGVGINNDLSNVTIQNNLFNFLEQPMKAYESDQTGSCNNCVIDYNSYNNFSRIGFETQVYKPGPILMYIQYNSFTTKYQDPNQFFQTYDISAANGCANTYASAAGQCETHTDYNVDEQLGSSNFTSVGFEIWGQGTNGCTTHCTTANYNLFQGWMQNSITWSEAGNFQFNNNTFNQTINNGNNQNCTVGSSGYWNKEIQMPPSAYNPTCNGNSYSTVITGTYPSAAPTLPSSTSFSGTYTVNITNSGTNRDTNTTDWCTTDGSTPSAGGGTSIGYTNGGSFNITTTKTVKCLGMWGSLNQPYSYASGFGYVPSSVVTATYTASGAVTLTSITVSSTGSIAALYSMQTNQLTATTNYSDSTSYNITTSSDPKGNGPATFSPSNSALGTFGSPNGFYTAGNTGGINTLSATCSTCGGVTGHFNMTTNVPVLQSITLSNVGNVHTVGIGGGTIQFTSTGSYSDGNQRTLPDVFGNTAGWSSSLPATGSINATGLFTPIAAGNTNILSTSSPLGIASPAWSMTVTATPAPINIPFSFSQGGFTITGTIQLTVTH